MKDRAHRKKKAAHLYEAATLQSRDPVFYAELGVPDTIDGRFEMLVLHCSIIICRLKNVGKTKLSQALFDKLFKQIDPMLREMGVGDLSVPKHMKRMMQGFNGRIRNYIEAIENKDKKILKEALVRNVYGTLKVEEVREEGLAVLADYVLKNSAMETDMPEFTEINSKEGNKNVAA
ncbi:MAG: ubiquinol-cytochrome C chaperone family protein [Pseudomonadota bacterium]